MIQFEEDDILHCVLIEPKKMNDEEFYKYFDEEEKKEYEESDEKGKKRMLKLLKKGLNLKDDEIKNFLKEINIIGKNELIQKMKEILPYQYYSALNGINKINNDS